MTDGTAQRAGQTSGKAARIFPPRWSRAALFAASLATAGAFLMPVGLARASSCPVPAQIDQFRQDHLATLNGLRGRHELVSLDANSGLDAVAQAYACLLVSTDTFAHVGPDGSELSDRLRVGGVSFCVATENLALGQSSVREVMAGWVGSPGHYRNLTNRDVRVAGLGVVALPREGGGSLATALGGKAPGARPAADANRYMWVQVFTAPCRP